jgi:hypothetical protein
VVRLEVMLACLFVAGAASADSARVRWRGVTVEGKPPASLQPAAAAHVAVALRQLGSTVVTAVRADVDASATCRFGAGRAARCVVVVARAAGGRAERRAEIRYRDAEDLAESLSLLVSDILTSEFPDVVGARPTPTAPMQPPVTTTTPGPTQPTPAPPPPTAAQERQHQDEMARQLALVQRLQREADERVAEQRRVEQRRAEQARADEAKRTDEAKRAGERKGPANASSPSQPRLPPPTRLALELGAAGIFGLGSANPSLVGGAARVVWTRGFLRVAGSLSLAGMRNTLDGHDLGFFRALVAARAGAGVRNALADFDVTAGPALLVLVADAHSEGSHTVASAALVVGPRLALTLSGRLALVVGGDLNVAVTDERVVAAGMRIAQFSRVSAEVTLGIAWRSR